MEVDPGGIPREAISGILKKFVSVSLTYRSPEASCNKRADTYFGRRTASLIKEFWNLCILLIFRNSYGENNPIFEYWSYTSFVDL